MAVDLHTMVLVEDEAVADSNSAEAALEAVDAVELSVIPQIITKLELPPPPTPLILGASSPPPLILGASSPPPLLSPLRRLPMVGELRPRRMTRRTMEDGGDLLSPPLSRSLL